MPSHGGKPRRGRGANKKTVAALIGAGAREPTGHQSQIQRSHAATRAIRRYQPRDRPCITCQTVFVSTGPQHRMCERCRRNDAYDGYV